MHGRRNRSLVVASLMALALMGCGKAKDKTPPKSAAPEPVASAPAAPSPEKPATDKPVAPPAPLADAKALAEEFGVAPGGIEHGKTEGPDGVVNNIDGSASVRRVGEEDFSGAKAGTALYAGDQLKTDAGSTATITLVDQTVIQLAADSAVALGDRDASADPASSAAVLYGAARFSVSPRAPGEGAFLVFAPGGVITTKGTVYAVGVAASGEARVGVEAGEVLLAGKQALDKLVALTANKSAEISVTGEVLAPVEFKADDWAEWRAHAEADADAKALAQAHLDALGNLETELDDAYADLATLSEAAAGVDAEASAQAKADDVAAYKAAAPEYGATIESTYLASLRLEQLTFATQSHAFVAEELYLRHPDEVAVVYTPLEARVHGAVLLNKKFRVVVNQRIRPLRLAFYAHHPEGRVHATVVGQAVPAFFLEVKLRPLPAALVRAHVHGPVFVPPRVVVKGKVERHVFVGAPDLAWRQHLTVKAVPARAGEWHAHGALTGKLMLGVKASAPRVAVFGHARLAPLAAAHISVRGEPIVAAARLKIKVKGGAAADVEHEAAGGVSGGLEAGAKLKGKGVHVVEHGAKGAAKAEGAVRGGLKAGVDIRGGVGVKVKVPRPPPPPKVKIQGGVKMKAKGGIKIGK